MGAEAIRKAQPRDPARLHHPAVGLPEIAACDPHVRRRTKRETNATAASVGSPRLDQGRAWSDIDAKLGEWSLFSPSADYHSGLVGRAESALGRGDS